MFSCFKCKYISSKSRKFYSATEIKGIITYLLTFCSVVGTEDKKSVKGNKTSTNVSVK